MANKATPTAQADAGNIDIEEIMAEVERLEKAPEPGTLHIKEIIHRGDADLPTPMVAQALDSAGWVFIYDTRTGERSTANRNNLRDLLRKKREDGSVVFSLRKPRGIEPHRGTFKCLLHPDDPNRPHYDELGLPTCRKANLTSQFQVEQHMRHRHKSEWATIQQEKTDRQQEEEQAFRRMLLEKAS